MLALPEPEDGPLARSPLALVVCQLRYLETVQAAELRAGLDAQTALGGRSEWQLEALKSTSWTVMTTVDQSSGMSNPPSGVEVLKAGWRLTSRDKKWTVTIQPEQASVETTDYGTWETFSARLRTLVDVVEKNVRPEAELRLGLRYVDQIVDPPVTTPAGWSRWIRPEVLGLLLHPVLAPGVEGMKQEIALVDAPERKATLRSGFVRDNASDQLVYILDVDAYRDGTREFEGAGILK
ncbi:MAG: TIGR04255 family protein, partial [Chloroflexota bacterium]